MHTFLNSCRDAIKIPSAEANCAGAGCSVWSCRCAPFFWERGRTCVWVSGAIRNRGWPHLRATFLQLHWSRLSPQQKRRWGTNICLYCSLPRLCYGVSAAAPWFCYWTTGETSELCSQGFRLALGQDLLHSLCPGGSLAGSVSVWLHTKALWTLVPLSRDHMSSPLTNPHTTLYYITHTWTDMQYTVWQNTQLLRKTKGIVRRVFHL